jgi:RNA polymerase sigma factor (sigma-70 family)
VKDIDRLASQASYLVTMMARKYVGLGLPFDDLVSAGNVGLVKAAYKFDEGKGVQFGTYAVFWIRKEIAEAVDNERYLIRVPRYAVDIRRRVMDHRTGRLGKDGEEPAAEELSRATGLSAVQIERGSQAFAGVESIHALWDDEGGLALEERIADPGKKGPSELVLQAESLQAIRRALKTLSPRERQVIALRYGVADQEPLTLRETAGRMGLSRERVRQIQQDALGRLRMALAPLQLDPRPARSRRPRSRAARKRTEL